MPHIDPIETLTCLDCSLRKRRGGDGQVMIHAATDRIENYPTPNSSNPDETLHTLTAEDIHKDNESLFNWEAELVVECIIKHRAGLCNASLA